MAENKPLYHLISMSRSVQTRVVRAHNPAHSGLKQFIGGIYRLIRKRPLVFTEELLLQHIDEIRKKNAVGMLEVRTPDGRLVDLETLKPGFVSPTPPKPVLLQDSIANDEPWGERMETVPGGVPMAEAFADAPDADDSFEKDVTDDFEDPEAFEEETDEEEEAEGAEEGAEEEGAEASTTPKKKAPRRRRKR